MSFFVCVEFKYQKNLIFFFNFSEVKPRMSFIPQSVLKKAAPTDNKIKADQNGGASSSKSNEDFRKLLMK